MAEMCSKSCSWVEGIQLVVDLLQNFILSMFQVTGFRFWNMKLNFLLYKIPENIFCQLHIVNNMIV